MNRWLGAIALAAWAAAVSPAFADLVDDCYAAGQDDPDKTIAICTRAINQVKTTNTRMATAYNNRGHAKIYKRDFDGAKTDIERAIRLNPKNQYAYDNLGDMWREKGDFDQAVVAYNHAIRIDGTFLAAYINRGMTFERMGNLRSARADFQAVLDASGQDREIDRWAKDEARKALERLDKK